MSIHEIDMSKDPRREQFAYFQTFPNPQMGVTVPVDVTELNRWRRRMGLGFFLPFLYCAERAANGVPELRRRLRNGGAVEYDWCPSSHTLALPDGTYGYCALRADRSFPEYLPYAAAEQERARHHSTLDDGEDAESLLFVSCLPWLSYTALIQPTLGPSDSNPRITWGRYESREGRLMLPVTLLAHHALVDGVHVAHFYEGLEHEMKEVVSIQTL